MFVQRYFKSISKKLTRGFTFLLFPILPAVKLPHGLFLLSQLLSSPGSLFSTSMFSLLLAPKSDRLKDFAKILKIKNN
jgi:hypothetical protein